MYHVVILLDYPAMSENTNANTQKVNIYNVKHLRTQIPNANKENTHTHTHVAENHVTCI